MSNAVMPLSDYKDTCDKIREKTASTDNIKSGELADKVNEVYEKGKQAEYDMFWDNFQKNGTRQSYAYAFYSNVWDDKIFRPKYDLVPTNATAMFKGAKLNELTSETIGVNIDFSKATTSVELFNSANIKKIGIVDLSSITGSNGQGTFGYNYYTETIEKLVLHENMEFTNFFAWSNAFKSITVEGIIARSISIHASQSLDKPSIISFINALSTTESGRTFTVNKTAINNAFETASGTADGSTSEEWLNLVATKPNWTISLST